MAILQVINLTKSFKGLTAVSNLHFNVEEGEVLGLMGPNGAGKTTVINLITGFLKPDSGTISWHHENIAGLKPHKIVRRGITRTFQQARVFHNVSIFDNVFVSLSQSDRTRLFPAADPKQRVLDIFKFVEMKTKPSILAKDLPQDELRRLEIARAISSDPKLLLLDEPVSGLTPEESDSIADIITRLNKAGITLVIIEHVMRMLMKVSHRLVVMSSGTKLSEGTPEEVRRDPLVAEAYLGKEGEELA
jgi:branched-chain amino acid transport system ATP-binding protein